MFYQSIANALTFLIGPLAAETIDSASETFEVHELDSIPKVITDVVPVYPKHEHRFHIKGTAVIELIVDENGAVTKAEVAECSREVFGQSALEAVQQWKFKPGIKDGQPVAVRCRIPMTFNPPKKRVWPRG